MTDYRLLRRLIRETLLREGVYDPGILKAVFLAGGPGSGKSHTAKLIFGLDPDSVYQTATASGLKIINSDPAFEHFLRKAGVSPGDLAKIAKEDPELSYQLGMDDKRGVPPDSPRGIAKRTRDTQKANLLSGKVGVLLDGTGDNYEKIARRKQEMEDLGYDTHMLFINTTLPVAQERNLARERKLEPEMVASIHASVMENLGAFQLLFGRADFAIIDNTEYGPIESEVSEAIDDWLAQPVENPIGRKWVETELAWKEHEFGKEDIERKAPGVEQRTLGTGRRPRGRPGAGVQGQSSINDPISDAEIESLRKKHKKQLETGF